MQRQGDFLYNVLCHHTGAYANYKKVTGITDAQCDGVIYRKLITNGVTEYFRRVFTSLNVDWFGAKGDGATDDTAAFQKAMDVSAVEGCMRVTATAGKTYIVNTVDLPKALLKGSTFLVEMYGVTLRSTAPYATTFRRMPTPVALSSADAAAAVTVNYVTDATTGASSVAVNGANAVNVLSLASGAANYTVNITPPAVTATVPNPSFKLQTKNLWGQTVTLAATGYRFQEDGVFVTSPRYLVNYGQNSIHTFTHNSDVNGNFFTITKDNSAQNETLNTMIGAHKFVIRGAKFKGVATSTGIRIAATYGSKVEDCDFESTGTAVDFIFCLKGIINNCMTVHSAKDSFVLQSARNVWDGGSFSNSQSNQSSIVSCRVFGIATAFSQYKILATSGVTITECIAEGRPGPYAIYYDAQGSPVVKDLTIRKTHIEAAFTSAAIYIKGTGIIAELDGVFSQYGQTLVHDESDSNSTVIIKNVPFIPATTTIKHNGTGTAWDIIGVTDTFQWLRTTDNVVAKPYYYNSRGNHASISTNVTGGAGHVFSGGNFNAYGMQGSQLLLPARANLTGFLELTLATTTNNSGEGNINLSGQAIRIRGKLSSNQTVVGAVSTAQGSITHGLPIFNDAREQVGVIPIMDGVSMAAGENAAWRDIPDAEILALSYIVDGKARPNQRITPILLATLIGPPDLPPGKEMYLKFLTPAGKSIALDGTGHKDFAGNDITTLPLTSEAENVVAIKNAGTHLTWRLQGAETAESIATKYHTVANEYTDFDKTKVGAIAEDTPQALVWAQGGVIQHVVNGTAGKGYNAILPVSTGNTSIEPIATVGQNGKIRLTGAMSGQVITFIAPAEVDNVVNGDTLANSITLPETTNYVLHWDYSTPTTLDWYFEDLDAEDGASVTSFIKLTDVTTPTAGAYTGLGGKLFRVKANETGLEPVDFPAAYTPAIPYTRTAHTGGAIINFAQSKDQFVVLTANLTITDIINPVQGEEVVIEVDGTGNAFTFLFAATADSEYVLNNTAFISGRKNWVYIRCHDEINSVYLITISA